MGLTVNETAYDYGCVRNKSNGIDLEGVVSISYSYKTDGTKHQGQGRKATKRTKGSLVVEDGELEIEKAWWDAWIKSIGPGFMDEEFTYTVSYADNEDEMTTDTLERCTFCSVKKNPKKGSDPLTVTVGLSIMNVLDNGLDPIDKNAK